MIFEWVFQPACLGGRSGCRGDGDEGYDCPVGCWLRRGGLGGAGGGGSAGGVRRPASGARPPGWLGFSYVFEEVVSLAVPVVGFVLASRRPGNRIGWLLLAAGLVLALRGFSYQYAIHALFAAPGSWPAGRVFGWLYNWTWVIPFGVLAFVFLIFPTGQLRSPRWRPAAWFVSGA